MKASDVDLSASEVLFFTPCLLFKIKLIQNTLYSFSYPPLPDIPNKYRIYHFQMDGSRCGAS